MLCMLRHQDSPWEGSQASSSLSPPPLKGCIAFRRADEVWVGRLRLILGPELMVLPSVPGAGFLLGFAASVLSDT